MDHRPRPPSGDVNLRSNRAAGVFRIESVECLRDRIREFIRQTSDGWSRKVARILLERLEEEKPNVADIERELYGAQQALALQQKQISALFSLPFQPGTHVQWRQRDESGVYLGPALNEEGHAEPEWARVQFGIDEQEIMVLPATALTAVASPPEDACRGL